MSSGGAKPAVQSASYNQFSDKQLMSDNQMLTNELIVINRDMTKLKQDLKKT